MADSKKNDPENKGGEEWFFTKEDFESAIDFVVKEEKSDELFIGRGYYARDVLLEKLEELTNARLRAEREKMPVVYGIRREDDYVWWAFDSDHDRGDTHRARLDGIQEL